MAIARWNGIIIAHSEEVEIVENNIYFPQSAITMAHLKPSNHTTHCPWKGDAKYYHVSIAGEVNENAAWYYPDPFEKAEQIKDLVAFWKGIEVER